MIKPSNKYFSPYPVGYCGGGGTSSSFMGARKEFPALKVYHSSKFSIQKFNAIKMKEKSIRDLVIIVMRIGIPLISLER